MFGGLWDRNVVAKSNEMDFLIMILNILLIELMNILSGE